MSADENRRRIVADGELVLDYLPFDQGRPVADDACALIINRIPDNPPWGGPWVSEVFEHVATRRKISIPA